MVFFDFEVFKYDWLVVLLDTEKKTKDVIHNDIKCLTAYYEEHSKDIWCGYNARNYDQYILKGILLGLDPKYINDQIIKHDTKGWQISSEFRKIPLYLYDVVGPQRVGLKTLEGFMGNDIRETDVPFDIDRPLTLEELESTIKYCTHDVEQTIEVFLRRINDFNSMMHIVKEFKLGLSHIGDTGAQVTSKVLGCIRTERNDEFDVSFLPCLKIKKYKKVFDWYKSQLKTGDASIYNNSMTMDVAGVPHTFGFGGLHGAPEKPVHEKGAIYHVDVNNYYPSILIAHGLVTRSAHNDNYITIYETRAKLKEKQLNAKTKEEIKQYKSQQLPYKQILNSLSGAMKDRYNPAYDPRNNNMMCINGQLLLLDLIEHLEVIEGFKLIQSNTDGLIVKIPDTDEAFRQLDDVCYEWECRVSTKKCNIGLALDQISEIYQKDVNNYLWLERDGSIGERKGAYLKELNDLDYDLPIVNEAMTEFMAHKTPIEKTINNCDELIKFQKIVKLSNKYTHVEHNGIRYEYKCYRVFASKDRKDGAIFKCGGSRGNNEKFANTPAQCFIYNDEVKNLTVLPKLDKQYYIKLTQERLKQYGII